MHSDSAANVARMIGTAQQIHAAFKASAQQTASMTYELFLAGS